MIKEKLKNVLEKLLTDMREYPIDIQSFSLEHQYLNNTKYFNVLLSGCYKITWDFMFCNENLLKYSKKAKVYQQTTIVML